MMKLGTERDSLGVIFDQVGTPTYAADLAEAMLSVVVQAENGHFEAGIYHYSNEGVTSWYDFAVQIAAHAKLSCKIRPVESSEYPTQAARPFYSVLNKSKIKSQYHVEIPHWTQSLNNCLNHLLITTKTE